MARGSTKTEIVKNEAPGAEPSPEAGPKPSAGEVSPAADKPGPFVVDGTGQRRRATRADILGQSDTHAILIDGTRVLLSALDDPADG